MHDIRLIRDDPAAFDEGLKKRGLVPLSGMLIGLDDSRRAAVSALQAAQERRNAISKEVGAAKKAKDEARADGLMAEMARLKEETPALAEAEKAAVVALNAALAEVPNTPGPDVPVGRDETGNVLKSEWGKPVALVEPKQHFELGEAWRVGGVGSPPLMDFSAAAKLSGSRFVVLRGELARLERALGQFMLDLHVTEHGYQEVSPPLMVRDDVMFGTAQLPKFRDDQFETASLRPDEIRKVARDYLFEFIATTSNAIDPSQTPSDLRDWLTLAWGRYEQDSADIWELFDEVRSLYRAWLIPTAEVPLTNLVRESILNEDELPLRFAALTPCFRAEAGAAGRDTRGMLRQHQFLKCELVSITTPDTSAQEHERMLGCAEAVLRKLDLVYQVKTLCTGDMGFASQKTWDIEVWLPGQGTFREVSSCSVCGDFQARRMDARYRPKGEKGTRHVHTLNGSGVAVGRALIAVLETYQQPDGSVLVPSALRSYMGGMERIDG